MNWLNNTPRPRGSCDANACLVLAALLGALWLAGFPALAEPVSTAPDADEHEQEIVKAREIELGKPVEAALPLQTPEVESGVPAAIGEERPVEKTEAEIAVARSIDLGEPVKESLPLQVVDDDTLAAQALTESKKASQDDSARRAPGAASGRPPPAASNKKQRPPPKVAPLVMLGNEVAPATSTRLAWSPGHSFEGIAVPIPVLVVNGARRGPRLCLTAAVHGDELNGIEIVRRVLYQLDADKLTGTVIGVPIVNLQGFRRSSRYLPDRRDLNRFFPGNPSGSSAARIAHSFFREVISHCTALVDLHTGSFYRTNLPQLRADLRNPKVLELTQGFDGTVVLHSAGATGTLRQAAVAAGIPAVTLEAGEPMRLQEKEVNHGVKSIQSLLGKLGMVKKSSFWGQPEPVYYQSIWVRVDQGGILFSEVALGERVKKNELLGTVTDPITNVRTEIRAPHGGRVLGMALNQVVMPGFAAYRIGIETSEDEVIPSFAPLETPATLHTSQANSDNPGAAETASGAGVFKEQEGLEDSE